MDSKPWYKSKTVWFNVAMTLLAATDAVPAVTKTFGFEMGPSILIIVGVVNLALRAVTNNGLILKK